MNFIPAIILAMAVSLDGFVVGITYGLKKIKISLLPILIISIASGVTMLASMSVGQFLSNLFSPQWAERIGGILLALMGIWLLYGAIVELLHSSGEDLEDNDIKELFTFKIESLGIIINILKEPLKADMDYSGVISTKEALFLGVALALDAFGAGIAAAMTGYNPIFTAIAVCIFKFIFLLGGIHLGDNLKLALLGEKIKLLPGVILILLGVFQIF
ncbi:sporulation membrane protein YtaF [Halonatronum saccharophilum]|uniref:sporulation membrane protein YtaF n=1 Tax=Halonatronum saccharophilum TaxID=150060 RepID=UPI000488A3A9|nr:sporulation membrane protein YtaF [Halonatronum saccharophilum]